MAGHGAIRLQSDGHSVLFSELSATYPLKLLSPRLHHPRVAAVYIMSYGGGLVGGDLIKLDVNVDSDAILLALTQVAFSLSKSRFITDCRSICRDQRKFSRADQDRAPRIACLHSHE
jgi:urease accessory protein